MAVPSSTDETLVAGIPMPRLPYDEAFDEPERPRSRVTLVVGAVATVCAGLLAWGGVVAMHGDRVTPSRQVAPPAAVSTSQEAITEVPLATAPTMRPAAPRPVAPASVQAPSEPAEPRS